MPEAASVKGADFNRLLDYVAAVQIAAVGPGLSVAKGASGVVLNVDASLRKQRSTSTSDSMENAASQQWFFGRIESYQIFGGLRDPQSVDPTDATNHINVWEYTFVEVGRKGMTDDKPYPASTAWGEVSGGKSGILYNLIELNNPGYVASVDRTTTPPTATGTYGQGLHGDGVDTTGSISSTGMEIQPIPEGTIVIVYPLQTRLISGIVTEYYTQYENGVDGECS